VSTNDLERKYKDWQKKLHPDLFQCNSEEEKENSAHQSAQVIKAYNVLLKPLSRAEYLLQLQGIHVDEEGTVTDPELLMEIMEVRESVEDANNADTLETLQSKIQAKLEECRTSFSAAYERHDFSSAVSSVQKMSYYERVNEEIIKKL
jgi:molecular chaperone HscB